MAGIISTISIIVSGIGIFFGFYYIAENVELAISIVVLSTVGILGVLAFVRHVIFHKSDAKRLGWETDRPDWMFEVGYANLAFGIIGILTVILEMGIQTKGIVIIGYAIYLFQGACLHGYRYFTSEKKNPAQLWRSFILSLLFVGMMVYFALQAL